MTTILITGADGFVGKHLAEQAKLRNFKVIGISKNETRNPHLYDDFITQDLSIKAPTFPEADAVVHLAGLAAVGPSFDNPQLYIETNSRITTNVCEELLRQLNKTNKKTKLISVSSGAVYQTQNRPIKETDPVNPSSPYVVSKLLVENQTTYYSQRGIPAVIARPFNHIGPGQQPGFIVPDLYAKLKANPLEIETGNLDSKRDYTDVRDVANAYLDLATSNAQGTFNICSGGTHSGIDFLSSLCLALDIELPSVTTRQERAIDPSRIVGSNGLIRSKVAWRVNYSFEDSINDFLKSQKDEAANQSLPLRRGTNE